MYTTIYNVKPLLRARRVTSCLHHVTSYHPSLTYWTRDCWVSNYRWQVHVARKEFCMNVYLILLLESYVINGLFQAWTCSDQRNAASVDGELLWRTTKVENKQAICKCPVDECTRTWYMSSMRFADRLYRWLWLCMLSCRIVLLLLSRWDIDFCCSMKGFL